MIKRTKVTVAGKCVCEKSGNRGLFNNIVMNRPVYRVLYAGGVGGDFADKAYVDQNTIF